MAPGSKSDVRTGWTVGGGEWLLTGRWSIKAEYLYVDFGSEKIAVPVSNSAAFHADEMEVDAGLTAHRARRAQLSVLIAGKRARDFNGGVGRRELKKADA